MLCCHLATKVAVIRNVTGYSLLKPVFLMSIYCISMVAYLKEFIQL